MHFASGRTREARGSCWSGTVAVEGVRMAAQKKVFGILRKFARAARKGFHDLHHYFPESRSNHPQREVEERDSPGHLSRGLLVLQKMIECPANDFVAFARSGFQPLAVDDLDSSASIAYEAPRSKRLCGQCHARAAQP